MTLTKAEYIARSLSKIKHKQWELYVISRVIHKLDDPDIEFKCQQLIRREEGFALVDLFFPQLQVYLEIDEAHHGGSHNELADDERRLEIFDATDFDEYRIKIYEIDGRQKITRELITLNEYVDDFVKSLRQKRREKTIIPWDIESKFSPEPHIDRGYICLQGPEAAFRVKRDALRCFGYTGGHYQRGAWRIRHLKDLSVWFPKLFNQGDWQNRMLKDGTKILEKNIRNPEDGYKRSMGSCKSRIVFAHEIDALGFRLYKFKGVFERDDIKSSVGSGVLYHRISTCVRLNKLDEMDS